MNPFYTLHLKPCRKPSYVNRQSPYCTTSPSLHIFPLLHPYYSTPMPYRDIQQRLHNISAHLTLAGERLDALSEEMWAGDLLAQIQCYTHLGLEVINSLKNDPIFHGDDQVAAVPNTPAIGLTSNRPPNTPEFGLTSNQPPNTPALGLTSNQLPKTPDIGLTSNQPIDRPNLILIQNTDPSESDFAHHRFTHNRLPDLSGTIPDNERIESRLRVTPGLSAPHYGSGVSESDSHSTRSLPFRTGSPDR